MTGHITDGVGFIRNLKEHGVEVKGQEMVIIGTVFIEDLDNKEKLAEVVSESNILVNASVYVSSGFMHANSGRAQSWL